MTPGAVSSRRPGAVARGRPAAVQRGPSSRSGAASEDRPEPSAADLAIAGLVPLSSVDWPGRLAAVAFCQGCPWRCTYCHNQAILDPRVPGAVPFAQLEALLERRGGLLDGVVFSGGEATAQHALVPAVRRVREMGFAVGLHTGGAYPARLRTLLGVGPTGERTGEPLVDWVGFDVKAAPTGYEDLVGRRGAWSRAEESLHALLASGVGHELRMTVTPWLEPQVLGVVEWLAAAGADRLVLQPVRCDGADEDFVRRLEGVPLRRERFDACVREAQARGEALGVAVGAREGQ